MAISVHRMRADEGRTFLDIHTRAVRGLARTHYPPEVIDGWTVPATDAFYGSFMANTDDEIRLIAELDGTPVGIGVLVLAGSELRACYVAPEGARQGVGTALVQEIERLARAHGLDRLEVLASLNAEPFYRALGYHSNGLTEHTL